MSTNFQSIAPDWLQDVLFSVMHGYKTTIRHNIRAQTLGLNGMHVRVLHALESDAQLATANDIVQKLQRDKAQVARLIKELISMELIVKSKNPNDKRSQLLQLTEQGIELTQKIRQAQNKVVEQMVAGITPTELDQFKVIMDKMINNLQTAQCQQADEQ